MNCMNFFTNANIMIAGSMHLIFINYHYRVMEQQWVSLLLITKEIFINVSICFAENSMRLEMCSKAFLLPENYFNGTMEKCHRSVRIAKYCHFVKAVV